MRLPRSSSSAVFSGFSFSGKTLSFSVEFITVSVSTVASLNRSVILWIFDASSALAITSTGALGFLFQLVNL